jgi:hypothetical protein
VCCAEARGGSAEAAAFVWNYCGDDACMRTLDEARIEIISALNGLLAEASVGGVPDMLSFLI